MSRKITLAGSLLLIFAMTVLILLRLMPGPHKPTDYLVIGTLATFVCILLAFIFFFSVSGKRSDMFYKRKSK